jgi:hypothetical protein
VRVPSKELYLSSHYLSKFVGALFACELLSADSVVQCLDTLVSELTHIDHALAIEQILLRCETSVWRKCASRPGYDEQRFVDDIALQIGKLPRRCSLAPAGHKNQREWTKDQLEDVVQVSVFYFWDIRRAVAQMSMDRELHT